jgi:hypothetical protein
MDADFDYNEGNLPEMVRYKYGLIRSIPMAVIKEGKTFHGLGYDTIKNEQELDTDESSQMLQKFRDEFENPNFRKVRELESEIAELRKNIKTEIFKQVRCKGDLSEDRPPERTQELRDMSNEYASKLRKSLDLVAESLGLNKSIKASGSAEPHQKRKKKYAPSDSFYQAPSASPSKVARRFQGNNIHNWITRPQMRESWATKPGTSSRMVGPRVFYFNGLLGTAARKLQPTR